MEDDHFNRTTRQDYRVYLDIVNGLYLEGVVGRTDLDVFGFDPRTNYSYDMVLPHSSVFIERERIALMAAVMARYTWLGSFPYSKYYRPGDYNVAASMSWLALMADSERRRQRHCVEAATPHCMHSTWPIRPLSRYPQDEPSLRRATAQIQRNWLWRNDDGLCKDIRLDMDEQRNACPTHVPELHAENPYHDVAAYRDRHTMDNLVRTLYHLAWQEFVTRREEGAVRVPHLSGDDILQCASQVLPASVMARAQLAYTKLKETTDET